MPGPDEANAIKVQYSSLAAQRDSLFSDYQTKIAQPLTTNDQVDAINAEVDQINSIDSQLGSLADRYSVVGNQYQEGVSVGVYDPMQGVPETGPLLPKKQSNNSWIPFFLAIAFLLYGR